MMVNRSCVEFVDILASKAPVPGGGGASALGGALGMALGSMVGNLTLGKKKYQDVQQDIENILDKAQVLQKELLDLVEKDAEVFEPLSRAYGLPKNTEEERAEKDRVMEEALKLASGVPLEIMEKAIQAIELHEELAVKGTRLAVSDVGVGVQFCRAALIGASLNVFINTKFMKDRETARKINDRTDKMLKEGIEKADRIYQQVVDQIR